jgi:hypothetical protein
MKREGGEENSCQNLERERLKNNEDILAQLK